MKDCNEQLSVKQTTMTCLMETLTFVQVKKYESRCLCPSLSKELQNSQMNIVLMRLHSSDKPQWFFKGDIFIKFLLQMI